MTKVNYDPTIKEGYINCDCGASFTYGNYKYHQNSKRHLSYLKTGDPNACFRWYGSHNLMKDMDAETLERVRSLKRAVYDNYKARTAQARIGLKPE